MKSVTYAAHLSKASVRFGFLLLMVGLAICFGQVRDDALKCKQVKATLTDIAPVTTNCPSPIGACYTGVISGSGLLKGTFFSSVTANAPSAGLTGVEPPTTLSFSGERIITTSQGTLTLRTVGVQDTARGAPFGEVAELNRVVSGTGQFAGASGTLWLIVNPADDTPVTVTGQICTTKP